MSVNKNSEIEGGLFAHYDAALEASQPALKLVAGTPAKQMDAPMRSRDCGPSQAIAAAAVAAGTVRLLGDAVETYNRRVDQLNATWRSAKIGNFGVAPMDGATDSRTGRSGGRLVSTRTSCWTPSSSCSAGWSGSTADSGASSTPRSQRRRSVSARVRQQR
ncbi:MAG TPA: hypothetical protein VEX15_15520 [Nocardioidaceae bacterium]|nr:hypothetical protein [Nocardioidaceae bacterium]